MLLMIFRVTKNCKSYVHCNNTVSPAEPSVDLDLEYIENVFTYLES